MPVSVIVCTRCWEHPWCTYDCWYEHSHPRLHCILRLWDVFCHVKDQKRNAGSSLLFSWCLWVKCDLSNQDFKPHHRLPEEILKWEFMEQTLTLRIPIWADQTTVLPAGFGHVCGPLEKKSRRQWKGLLVLLCSSEFYVSWSLGILRHVWLFFHSVRF